MDCSVEKEYPVKYVVLTVKGHNQNFICEWIIKYLFIKKQIVFDGIYLYYY